MSLVTQFNQLNLVSPTLEQTLEHLEHLIDSRNRVALKLPKISIEEFRLVSSKDKHYTQEKVDALKALPLESITDEFEHALVQVA